MSNIFASLQNKPQKTITALIMCLMAPILTCTDLMADDVPSGLDPAVAKCIVDKSSASAAFDASIGKSSDMDQPTFNYSDIAECLYDLKRYQESIAEWHLEGERLESMPADPLNNVIRGIYLEGITRSYLAVGDKSDAITAMNKDFELNHGGFLFDRHLYLQATAGVLTPGKQQNRSWFAKLSQDQQDVIMQHEGSKDYNENARPCHVSSMETRSAIRLTWWYCTGDNYSKAYDFVNGRLQSAYTP